jgi:hypothetical protein
MTSQNAIPQNPDVLRANSLIGQARTARTAAEWRTFKQALLDAERDAIVWEDLVAAAEVRATEAEVAERRAALQGADNALYAAVTWMLSLVTQHAGTSQEGFAREVVLAATSEHAISDDAREWLRRLTARGDHLHRAWAVRLMRECEDTAGLLRESRSGKPTQWDKMPRAMLRCTWAEKLMKECKG